MDHIGPTITVISLIAFGIFINRDTIRQFSSLPTLREVWPIALLIWGAIAIIAALMLLYAPRS